MKKLLGDFFQRAEKFMAHMEASLPGVLQAPDWNASIAFRYRKRSSGQGVLEPVRYKAQLLLDDIKMVDRQKADIIRNTEQFVRGKLANHVLLTGSRGTGKSSLVKACLNAYADQGLRLIEVDKTDLIDLPDLIECVSDRPEKFIIFTDDLSFEEGDGTYKVLKSVLDGTVSAMSENILVYATSNRRHLLPEYMSENLSYSQSEDGEVHPGEVVEEKISLSERFGLWLNFYPFGQDEYLVIVEQWLKHFGVNDVPMNEVHEEALIWALERGSRSGRVAYQFARDFAGRLGVQEKNSATKK
ncbi:MAG: ATP-binding protein [Saezia sp.]